jgi:hypothetical protein
VELRKIKRGSWYDTTHGCGQCVSVGGTFPPSVQIEIVAPLPLGRRTMRPRDVLRLTDPPEIDGVVPAVV